MGRSNSEHLWICKISEPINLCENSRNLPKLPSRMSSLTQIVEVFTSFGLRLKIEKQQVTVSYGESNLIFCPMGSRKS